MNHDMGVGQNVPAPPGDRRCSDIAAEKGRPTNGLGSGTVGISGHENNNFGEP